MEPLVRMIKVNDLQYNANRDPQAYRRCINQPFRIQALLRGKGDAHCTLSDAAGSVIMEQSLALPGLFSAEIAYPSAGTRVVTLAIEAGPARFVQDLRLDVLEHAWIG